MISRRDFGKLAIAGLPLAKAFAASGVTIGVQTYSYRDSGEPVPKALHEDGVSVIELYMPGVKSPDRRDFAGVNIHSCTMVYKSDFTDDQIDRTFEQAHALGTNIIATSTQISLAPRLLKAAEKHGMLLAFHGHSDAKNPDEFSSPESFQKALDMSKAARVNLDIGHFFAAGFDPVAYITEHYERITHLHIKDRKKNNGPNVPWGEGDTPIKPVLALLKEKKYPIPALVEYEYKGQGTPVEEVRKCLAYMRQALA